MDSRIDLPRAEHDRGTETPVIEFSGDELDAGRHPFDAAERVLAATS